MKYLIIEQEKQNIKVMNRKTIIFVLISAGFFLAACQKNTDLFVPDPGQLNGPDTAWYGSITATMPVSTLKANLVIEPYQDSITVNSNVATILTPFGLQVTFPPNSCIGAAGQTLTGKVTVEMILVKKKGDMIRLNKPTTSNNRLLVSGGELFISLNKNGQNVQLAPGVRYNIHYADPAPNQLMKFFAGDESNIQQFNWLPGTSSSNDTVMAGTQAYEIYTSHLRWINCAYFYDTTGIPRVNVSAELASHFTNANTVAFTVFKDYRSVVGMYGDITTRKFSTGKLPGGKAITVVVISKQGNDYFLGYESAVTITSTPPNATQSVLVKPIKRSLADILYYLSTL